MFISGQATKCVTNPKNINSVEFQKYKNGIRSSSPSKLKGEGNFTDYTPKMLEKDKKEKDLNMLISRFVLMVN